MSTADDRTDDAGFWVCGEPWEAEQCAGPYATLEDALAMLGDDDLRHSSGAEVDSAAPRAWRILKARNRPSARPPKKRARHHFSVVALAEGAGGEGTQASPWWGIQSAAAAIAERARAGAIQLRDGEYIEISCRQVFSPPPLERRKRRYELLAAGVFGLMSLALVVPVVAILAWLTMKAWPALSPSFLLENPRDSMTAGGIWSPLVGTFFLVFASLMIAAPVGVLAGVYMHEYARDNWLTRLINLAVVNLAGVPSIVHGLFGVGAFVLFAGLGRSVLAAACTLAVMTLPVIITSTREALAAVPMSFREACWNMGATRWQTIRTIVLPNAVSGILTGVILQVARAAGETAPILFTGAVYFVPTPDEGLRSFFPYSLTDRCMALSMHLFTLLTQALGVPESTEYGTAVVLIALVLAVNSLSIGLRSYLRSRKKW
jgi:phosphate transport system permease protein